ncbi:Gfo/Idh/MocA family oxidoreductase [Telmatocola sphagniphila]|uniref:Gfo/Idh/MocA family oxidoreductase n=1 Tax=Telmatocola sphagniphila TaxID=1123043 RepID=A0A8E6B296_9BACT|nr:Gfo/Idh/MocA family oxidoreductase [Telmatocola sphagniphila]QVL30074.1 Gfo/Idh/MocA family oxidoreductase [Telmatocola sphagniphila]
MHFNRRTFLQASAVAVPSVYLPQVTRASANERINVGFIGMGVQSRGHMYGLLNAENVQVVAVSDVVVARREDAQKKVNAHYEKKAKGTYKGCAAVNDFREIIDRKDIDAVVICTPDHWHAIPCILAARAKKDIYCEKPLTHDIAEGRRIVEEAAKTQVIFQTGSQQRSEFGGHFRKAVELVRNGRIGKVKTIKIGVGAPNKPCDLATEKIPEGTDWEFWLGPAPERGYNKILCPEGIHNHYPAWRNYREFAGGGVADMGAHHFDIAQWALDMDNSGPTKILPPANNALMGLKLVYSNGVEMIHEYQDKAPHKDCVFIGEKGTIYVSRAGISSDPEEIVKTPIGEKEYHVYPSKSHIGNWVDCIRSRKPTICPAEVGHRTATICHLVNIGYQLHKNLTWDPVAERFDDAEANKLISREPRAQWKI